MADKHKHDIRDDATLTSFSKLVDAHRDSDDNHAKLAELPDACFDASTLLDRKRAGADLDDAQVALNAFQAAMADVNATVDARHALGATLVEKLQAVLDIGRHLDDVDHAFKPATKALWEAVRVLAQNYSNKLLNQTAFIADGDAFKIILDQMDSFADANNNKHELEDLNEKIDNVVDHINAFKTLLADVNAAPAAQLAAQGTLYTDYQATYAKALAMFQLVSSATGSDMDIFLRHVQESQPWVVAVTNAMNTVNSNTVDLDAFKASFVDYAQQADVLIDRLDFDGLMSKCMKGNNECDAE